MGLATLGGIAFRIDPMAISWSYSIKTSVTETVGGRVVQVFGTTLSDMVVQGKFSSWQEQAQFLERVKAWIDSVTNQRDQPPLRFTYSPRNWDFLVYVTQFSQPGGSDSIDLSSGEIAPDWALTLFIVEDNGGLRKIKDQALENYIVRLSTGIGWRQTAFNGPLGDAEVQSYLSGVNADTVVGAFINQNDVEGDREEQG